MEAGQIVQSDITHNSYKLVENIGSGTYAQCWEAEDVATSEKVCLKVIEYYLLDDYQKANSQHEASMHATFVTRTIVRFHEAFFIEGLSEGQQLLVIVMELG